MISAQIIVGPGEVQAAGNEAELCCQNIGGGIVVAAYDPEAQVGACGHFILPCPPSHLSIIRPAKYVDTGVQEVLLRIQVVGGIPSRVSVAIVGGAGLMTFEDASHPLDLGARNLEAVHRAIDSQGLKCEAEDVGGQFARSLELNIVTGVVKVRTAPHASRTLCRLRGA